MENEKLGEMVTNNDIENMNFIVVEKARMFTVNIPCTCESS